MRREVKRRGEGGDFEEGVMGGGKQAGVIERFGRRRR